MLVMGKPTFYQNWSLWSTEIKTKFHPKKHMVFTFNKAILVVDNILPSFWYSNKAIPSFVGQ